MTSLWARRFRCFPYSSRGGIAAAIALVAISAPPHLGQATIVNLGARISGPTATSDARGVGAHGTFVVGASNGQAFRWSAAGGLEALGVPPGGSASSGIGVSDDGSIVVGNWSAPGGNRAMRWTAATGAQELGLAPQCCSQVHAMSPDGAMVVGSALVNGRNVIARWRQGGILETFGTLGNNHDAYAFGVSDDLGTIVGRSDDVDFSQARGLRWTAETGVIEVGVFLGSPYSDARAVNADGSIIAGASGTAGEYRAFRWTRRGGLLQINANMSLATGISANGQTIVGTQVTNGSHAFLWNRVVGSVDLATYAAACGANMTGWTLLSAYISRDGEAIVGPGLFQGAYRGYLIRGLPRFCAADLDGDGVLANGGTPDLAVTMDDFRFMLAAFEAGDLQADLDDDGQPATGTPDGAVTIEDLLFFLARFEAGC